jgi:hypothetical protein
LGWSGEGRYLVYERFLPSHNEEEGIRILDIKTGQSKWLIQTDLLSTHSLLSLSPDKKTFALLVGSPNQESILYTFAPDGSHLQELIHAKIEPNYSVWWSADSEWIYFYQPELANPAQGRNSGVYQIHPDGTDYGQQPLVEPQTSEYRVYSPDKSQYFGFAKADNVWMLYDTQTETPIADQPTFPVQNYLSDWLPNGWLLFYKTIPNSTGQRQELWAVRADGTESKLLVEGGMFYTFETEDYIYEEITLQTQRMRLVALDKETLTPKVLIEEYTTTLNANSRFLTGPNKPITLLWSKEEDWFIWRSADLRTYYKTRFDGSLTEVLYTRGDGAGSEKFHFSPDGKWFILTYIPTPAPNNPDWRMIRIRLADSHQEILSKKNYRLLGLSLTFSANYHLPYFKLGGSLMVGLASVAMLWRGWRNRLKH